MIAFELTVDVLYKAIVMAFVTFTTYPQPFA